MGPLHRPVGPHRRAAIRSASAVVVASLASAAHADSIPPLSPGQAAPLSAPSQQTPAFALPQLAGQSFRADASTPPSTAPAPGPLGLDLQGQNLLGDMWGLRPALAKYGVTLTILENVETFGNLSGGVKQGFEADGLTTVTLQMDTEKAFGLNGGTLNVSGLQYWGGNLSTDNLMVLQTLTDIEAPVGVRLWELWYQQKFGDKFDIKIGEQSLDEEFIIAPSGNSLFINAMSGWPGVPTIDLPGGGPAYPLAGLGIRGRAQVTDSVTVLAGVFNGSPIPFDSPNAAESNPHGVSFPLDTGTLAIAELQYALGSSASGKANADGPLPGRLQDRRLVQQHQIRRPANRQHGPAARQSPERWDPGDASRRLLTLWGRGSDGLAFEGQHQSESQCVRPSDVHAVPGSQPCQRQHQRGLRVARPVAGARQRCLRRRNGDRVGEQRRIRLRPTNAILPALGLHAHSLERNLSSRRPISFSSCPRGRFSPTSSISSIRPWESPTRTIRRNGSRTNWWSACARASRSDPAPRRAPDADADRRRPDPRRRSVWLSSRRACAAGSWTTSCTGRSASCPDRRNDGRAGRRAWPRGSQTGSA